MSPFRPGRHPFRKPLRTVFRFFGFAVRPGFVFRRPFPSEKAVFILLKRVPATEVAGTGLSLSDVSEAKDYSTLSAVIFAYGMYTETPSSFSLYFSAMVSSKNVPFSR